MTAEASAHRGAAPEADVTNVVIQAATATDADPDLTLAAATTPAEASAGDTLAAAPTRETSAAPAPAQTPATAADTHPLLKNAATLRKSRLAATRDELALLKP